MNGNETQYRKSPRVGPAPAKNSRTVSHYSLQAKVYRGADGFHAVWYADGKRIKRQFKTLKDAKNGALEALKLIHKGQGSVAALSSVELTRLVCANKLLHEAGYPNLLLVVHEYLAAKESSGGSDLTEAARFWATSKKDIERVAFEDAANDWFKTHNYKWKVSNKRFHESRIRRLVKTFIIDVCDLSFEPVRLFLTEELGGFSSKYRNHFRETLGAIIKHSIDRGWLYEKHGLDSLLKNEKVLFGAPKIISPETFQKLLELSDEETLPVVALMGFCGARRSETMRLNWADVWSAEGFVVLSADQTKTGQRRLVERCEALEAWLEPYRSRTGVIWPHSEGSLNHVMKLLRKAVGISGVHNALRHSFATYKLAVKRDANALALEMGNSPQILQRHYLELATPRQGKQWFSLMPECLSGRRVIKIA